MNFSFVFLLLFKLDSAIYFVLVISCCIISPNVLNVCCTIDYYRMNESTSNLFVV